MCDCSTYIHLNDYDIHIIDDYLSAEEADDLLTYLKKSKLDWFDSMVWRDGKDSVELDRRVCQQVWLKDYDHPLFSKIRYKNSLYLGKNVKEQERLLALKYDNSGFFKEHRDCGQGQLEDSKRTDIHKRQWTTVIYLNDCLENSGGTHFPLINQTCYPKKGRACLFQSTTDDGRVIIESLHQGLPVVGEKYIINSWCYRSYL